MGRLQDKVAFITGGSSGIGRGILQRYRQEGAKITCFDLNESDENPGNDFLFIKGDVTDERQIEKGIAATVEKFGRLDICVNVAGLGGAPARVVDDTFENFDMVLKVCLYGCFYGIKHAGSQMLKQGNGGVIISISSLNSTVPNELMGPYCTAKAGVDQLTRVASMELGPDGIRVCAINPGFIKTPLLAPLVDIPGASEEVLAKTPLKRFGNPTDIGNMALFLASEEASFITGSTFYVDGGQALEGYPDVIPLYAKAMAEAQLAEAQ